VRNCTGFPVELLSASVAHVWRQFLTYRKWNCSAVLVSLEAASLEMYTEVASGKLEKVGDNIYAEGDASFSHWIALSSCCTHLAPISDVPEVELQCGFSLYGSYLSGDVH